MKGRRSFSSDDGDNGNDDENDGEDKEEDENSVFIVFEDPCEEFRSIKFWRAIKRSVRSLSESFFF